ncbi:MAG TPA: hypothetical protein PLB38_02215 [bacterium]|nr:hypothetical protein [bacterium]
MALNTQFKGQKINIVLANLVIKFDKIIIAVLMLILLAGIGYFVAYPFYQHYQFFSVEEIPMLQTTLAKEQAELQALKEQYEQRKSQLLQVKLERVENLIAKNNDYTQLYLPIEKVVKDSGFILNNLSINDDGLSQFGERQLRGVINELSDWQLGEFTVQLDVTGGDYETMKKFLLTLEQTGRLYDVVSLSFNPQSYVKDSEAIAGREDEGVAYNIVLKTYYVLPKSAEASALTNQ